MKKMVPILLAGALVLGMMVTGTLAAGHWGRGGGCHDSRLYYQDANGDGVCDNHGTNCNYVDADGDGICDNQGSGLGLGSGQGCQGGGHHAGRWN